MQMQINVTVDLGTAAGQAEFRKLFGYMLLPTLAPGERLPDTTPLPSERPMPLPLANPSSIPDDPDRAAAAKAGRQEAAAKARAAKAAKAAGNGQADDSGADLSGPEGANGQDQAVEDELGLMDPNMSPAEAKEAGLALVREAYAAGKVAQVKALQKAWGIAKFYDIPNDKGHEFFAAVMKLAHETGLRK